MSIALVRTALRSAVTPEARLWEALRAGQLYGLRFRRQAPIGPYIVDFICLHARLVVAVDGPGEEEAPADRLRDSWLAREGFRVLRVWRTEVIENLAGVLEIIHAAARGTEPAARTLAHEAL